MPLKQHISLQTFQRKFTLFIAMTTIHLYGVLGKFADQHGKFSIEISEGMTVSKLKTALKDQLCRTSDTQDASTIRQWIDDSTIANHSDFLGLDEIISQQKEISVLPTACGG